LAEFHENMLSLSENIAKSFRGGLLVDSHCMSCFSMCPFYFYLNIVFDFYEVFVHSKTVSIIGRHVLPSSESVVGQMYISLLFITDIKRT